MDKVMKTRMLLMVVPLLMACSPIKKVQQRTLPNPTKTLWHYVDVVETKGEKIEIDGWAALPDRSVAPGTVTKGALLVEDQAYIIPTTRVRRRDVTDNLKTEGKRLMLDDSGFHMSVPIADVPPGHYPLALHVRAPDGTEMMVVTNKTIIVP